MPRPRKHPVPMRDLHCYLTEEQWGWLGSEASRRSRAAGRQVSASDLMREAVDKLRKEARECP